MLNRIMLVSALFLPAACDGPFEMKGKGTPGDPFSGDDFAMVDEQSDPLALEESCHNYCNLQARCGDWEASECVADCIEPAVEQRFADRATPPQCGAEFAVALECFAAADCDSFAECDAVMYDYVDCVEG